jgi:predicted nucleic acid-binding protein
MRVIVADTTPIRYLVEIGQLDVLPQLFGTIFIPSVVYGELQHPGAPLQVRNTLKSPPGWLKVMTTATSVDPALLALDEGEQAALMLGLELHADLILIDERKGAAVARQKGFEITGTLGILVLAARRELIGWTRPSLCFGLQVSISLKRS